MKVLLLACALVFTLKVVGQEADTIQLREVLISARIAQADSLPDPGLQAPIQTMDLLDRIPGVVRAQASSFPISYRGQTGSRMRIQQNGARRSGLNPQGYLAQDLNPANLSAALIVEGIEKAIYGSGAIGGVLILEDRQAIEPSPHVIYSQFATNNHARQLGFRGNGGNDRFNFEIAGNGIKTSDFHFTNREKSRNSALEEYLLSSALSGKLKKAQVEWRQKWSSGNWQFPQGFQNNPFELRELQNGYTYQSDLKLQHALKNGWHANQQIWGLALKTDQLQNQYNAQFDAINFQIERSYRLQGFGYNGWAQKTFDKYDIKAGMDFFISRLNENRTENDQVGNTITSQMVAQREDRQAGIFLKVNTSGKNIQWTGVLRADIANTNNLAAERAQASAISGGLEASWKLWKIDHQIAIGRYFRFPRPEESGGELFGGRGVFRGNPNIQPEYSYQLEWILSKTTKLTSFKISSWLAYFEDRIVEVPVERNVFLYDNIDQARTFGLEWQFSQVLLKLNRHNLLGNLSGMAMQGDDLTDVGLFAKGSRSNGIPPANFQGELKYKTWAGTLPLQFSGNVRHFTDFIAPSGFTNQVWAVRDAPAYTLLGLQANTRFRWNQQELSITLSAANLTDQAYFPFGTRVMGMGRDYRFGIKYSF